MVAERLRIVGQPVRLRLVELRGVGPSIPQGEPPDRLCNPPLVDPTATVLLQFDGPEDGGADSVHDDRICGGLGGEGK
jgi:hypothetical protein